MIGAALTCAALLSGMLLGVVMCEAGYTPASVFGVFAALAGLSTALYCVRLLFARDW